MIMSAMVFIPWLTLKAFRLEKWIPLPMAQIAFGICFGPSAFGSSWPELWSVVFTDPVKMGLDAIRVLAITVFAFIAGIELKPKELINREGNAIWRQAFQIIIVPIILASIGFILFFDSPIWHGETTPFWTFAWSMGVATCITAMPMLVIACKSLGIWRTNISQKLLGLVAFDDLVLYLTASIIISLGQSLDRSIIFFIVIIILYHLWPKILNKVSEDSYPTLTVAMALSMATLSYWAGLHFVLGAFFAGMITPRQAVKWNEGMEYSQMFWLMPVFFIWTGLKTTWSVDLATVLLAAVGMFIISLMTKFIGVWLAYRNEGWQSVCFKTALLQNKGLMEILLVGMLLTAGVISANMFAAVVIMSLISTISAVPMARLFYKHEKVL